MDLKPSNKLFKFSIVLGIAITLTGAFVWFTWFKGWMSEDAFFWCISFIWPYVVFSYIGEFKPAVAALVWEFLQLLREYLHGKITAQMLIERIVILIKNAVMIANDLAGIKDANASKKLSDEIDAATKK